MAHNMETLPTIKHVLKRTYMGPELEYPGVLPTHACPVFHRLL